MTVMPNLPQLLQRQDVAFSFWCKQVPEGALAVTAFAAEEAISGLTRTEVLLSSRDGAIDLNALLDAPVTLSVHHKYLPQLRHFSGVVVECERGDSGHHRTVYRLTLLPVLYRLDIRSDCRIFPGRSVPDIARPLFAEHGIENIQWEITDTHALREYPVAVWKDVTIELYPWHEPTLEDGIYNGHHVYPNDPAAVVPERFRRKQFSPLSLAPWR